MQRKLFCWTASEASGGGAERSKFAVRIFVKKSSDFVQKVPLFYGAYLVVKRSLYCWDENPSTSARKIWRGD
jgi:hypothetical protein